MMGSTRTETKELRKLIDDNEKKFIRIVKQIAVHEEVSKDGDRNITMEIHYNFRLVDESKILRSIRHSKTYVRQFYRLLCTEWLLDIFTN